MKVAVEKLAKMFGAVLVTGARQVGKTTLLKKAFPEVRYITLDDPVMLRAAVEESATFFRSAPPPVFVDEIQYAPQLFPQIKMLLDAGNKKGRFYLSGSQQFQMMKNVSETLAGRLGIVNLLGLSMREIRGSGFLEPFLPSDTYFKRRGAAAPLSHDEIWDIIHRGGMPELCANTEFDRQMFYGAYVKTYIGRDVRDLTQVGDEIKFMRFMTVAAANTGQLLNLSSLARDVGVSVPTADRWLSVLAASGIVYLLRPYHNSIIKRAVKTPKLYFLDTGLAAYLTRWTTPDVLRNGAMAGAFFETFVVSEVIKSYSNAGVLEPPLFFYRDKDMREIDLLIEDGGVLHPVEIKKHADPKASDIAAFGVLDKIPGVRRGAGGAVCMYDALAPLKGGDMVIPVGLL
ncbi:MAG: ATP-binding protein [Chitinispirillia bacterium]|nr:ATP-binding protein [Chitinispirillia bacterium]MCL2241204.1 ATP-binding protein [Chitinispirillia bacterium]